MTIHDGPTGPETASSLGRDVLLLGAMLGASLVLQRAALAEVAPFGLALFRLLAGLAFFVPLFPRLRLEQLRKRRVLLDVVVVGALSPGLSIACLTLALETASSGLVALLAALAPLFAALLGSLGGAEPPLRRRQMAGLTAAFSGAVLLLATRSTGLSAGGDGDVRGLLFAVANAVCFGASAVYARRRLGGIDSLTAAAGQTAGGLVLVAPFALLFGLPSPDVSLGAWASVLLAGAGGIGAVFVLQARMVQRHGSTATLLALYVMPIITGALGIAFLGEAITAPLAAGAALVLLGLSLFIGPAAFGARRLGRPWSSVRIALDIASR